MRPMDGHRGPGPQTPDELYDDVVRQALPWLSLGLAALHVCLAATNATLLTGTARVVATTTCAVGATAFLAVWFWVRHGALPRSVAHPVSAGMILLVVAIAVSQLVVTEDPGQTAQVLLVVAGSGVALLSLRWLAATLYLTWGAWGAGAVFVGSSDQWARLVVAMTVATALAAAANFLLRRVVRELAEVRAMAEANAVRDNLTGLANRRGLSMVGAQIAEHARRSGDAIHCIFVDVVGLRSVNETFGREAGDDVLCSVAEAVRNVTRSTDVVARWSGDEFAVVGPGPGMPPAELERRVQELLRLDMPLPAEAWKPQVSAGGAMLAPWDSGSLDTLLGKADHEMFLRRALRREFPAPAARRASAE